MPRFATTTVALASLTLAVTAPASLAHAETHSADGVFSDAYTLQGLPAALAPVDDNGVWALSKQQQDDAHPTLVEYYGRKKNKKVPLPAGVSAPKSITASAVNDMWLADDHSLFHYEGKEFAEVPLPESLRSANVSIGAIHTLDNKSLYVGAEAKIGDRPLAFMYQFDGVTWTQTAPIAFSEHPESETHPAQSYSVDAIDVTNGHLSATVKATTDNGFVVSSYTFDGAGWKKLYDIDSYEAGQKFWAGGFGAVMPDGVKHVHMHWQRPTTPNGKTTITCQIVDSKGGPSTECPPPSLGFGRFTIVPSGRVVMRQHPGFLTRESISSAATEVTGARAECRGVTNNGPMRAPDSKTVWHVGCVDDKPVIQRATFTR